MSFPAGLLANLPNAVTAGDTYVATDQPRGQQLYICDASGWYQHLSLGGSGLLAFTAGALDVNTAEMKLLFGAPTPVVAPPPPPPTPSTNAAASANGTTIPIATEIVDAAGIVWTLASGLSYQNGKKDGGAAITLLLYWGGIVFAQTTANPAWWANESGIWRPVVSGDPRVSA